ncbi:DUF3560 domain-containing protein [Sphingobacterium sp. UME9]|uniref:DUF3560 domain-containing protein n=1 Tax=Sphingobacterium TaxID=28453 RepID=UPI001601580F|nr:DUF3560 domain-containing protein [Sphingobacterium sp. UME9]MBB1642784.1 hypothetical protein [Sphingobacterium sp. UME9]
MEKSPHYIINQETGKLNIYSEKEFFEALPAEQKDTVKRYCLWSGSKTCWISKAKSENAGYLRRQLESMGFIYKETIGEKLSFVQQIQREKEKSESRAERALARAAKSDERSEQLYGQAKSMAGQIPFGQPILIGHHSEKADRNFRDKIHNKFGKAFEEMDKAEFYRKQAERAKKEALGKKFEDPFYLVIRIKECERDLKVCNRRLEGKFYAHSKPEPISEKEKLFYEERLIQIQEKLDFYKGCLSKIPDQKTIENNVKAKRKGKGL